jgi:hypothetical protein
VVLLPPLGTSNQMAASVASTLAMLTAKLPEYAAALVKEPDQVCGAKLRFLARLSPADMEEALSQRGQPPQVLLEALCAQHARQQDSTRASRSSSQASSSSSSQASSSSSTRRRAAATRLTS